MVKLLIQSGSNSMVESQPSKLLVASSILVSRSIDQEPVFRRTLSEEWTPSRQGVNLRVAAAQH